MYSPGPKCQKLNIKISMGHLQTKIKYISTIVKVNNNKELPISYFGHVQRFKPKYEPNTNICQSMTALPIRRRLSVFLLDYKCTVLLEK